MMFLLAPSLTVFLTLTPSATANVVFSLSSLPNGQGDRRSWLVNRWTCKNLAPEGFDDQASWAFVDVGLANGCEIYE